MQQIKLTEGKLKMDVSSNGDYIKAGSNVIVWKVIDNFKNISIQVISLATMVQLSYSDTNVDWLV